MYLAEVTRSNKASRSDGLEEELKENFLFMLLMVLLRI